MAKIFQKINQNKFTDARKPFMCVLSDPPILILASVIPAYLFIHRPMYFKKFESNISGSTDASDRAGTSATVETPAKARMQYALIHYAKGQKDYLKKYNRLIKIEKIS
jgi:hypothetical protein